ncbi:MAG: 16S rRNA (guanine(527)-N(7))-methyltransferase RsmG [Lachnospiraceae bacterium]|nr:16S rRNA (guanine(527)-N(7))-methyltransferase RsmG [Lachnospiraceae bacterium]
MNKNVDKFCKGLQELGIDYTQDNIEKFLKYYDILIEKNKVMNLTAITEFDDVVSKHFLDSLSIVKVMDLSNIENLIDVGTGAGFPGIPIKIMFPDIKVTLLDSLNKRIKFLGEVAEELKLNRIDMYHGRAEELGRNVEHREKYDLCVSRAVANLSSLSEYCLPFVKVDGRFVSYKSGDCDKEIEESGNAINKLSGNIEKVEKFNLPDSDISRSFVSIVKVKKISDSYPRKSGIPLKKPL